MFVNKKKNYTKQRDCLLKLFYEAEFQKKVYVHAENEINRLLVGLVFDKEN